MNIMLFPQLSSGIAENLFANIGDQSISDLASSSSASHDLSFRTPTGGRPASEHELSEIQQTIRGLAERFGYPESDGADKAGFDARCAVTLATKLDICPAEAMREGVWAFFGLVLLPDIVAWRFKERNRRRFVGGIRNVFQRLWLRGFRLNDDNDTPALRKRLENLTEDTFLHLIERPGVSSNPHVSTRIAEAWMRNRGLSRKSATMDQAHENVMMELVQTGAVICLDTIPDEQLDEMLDSLYSDQISYLQKDIVSAAGASF